MPTNPARHMCVFLSIKFNNMKAVITILTFTLLLTSCGEDPVIQSAPLCQEIDFDTSFEMQVGDSACLPDGSSFKVLEVRDEFCPCFALCVWEGQLVMKIETKKIDGETENLEIGSTQNIPFGNIFDNIKVDHFSYIYNGSDDTLPLCTGTYDQDEIIVKLSLSEIN